ncbi:hypothetical protein [Mucilaginibacter sp. OK098]|uniref:hypothetical protein n=1 Tax=Mucilaginibacter sp. OK098 TaxID=1855297 RepID=UPI0009222342|nr:hypothetical protein [Mucilaginibacter sp. OK098]SHM50303.1 hypothetical protein SAMN05216524_102318 [Mucilaginibacter sp. OK098]
MKKLLPIILIGSFIAFLDACKKDNNNSQSAKIVGKWQETKLNIHESNGTAVDRDTTFPGNSFTTSDYIKFNTDKTAAVSQSGIYTITGKGHAVSEGTIDVSLINYTYEVSDSTLTLMPVLRHPTNGSGGNGMESIVQLDATHLVLRTYYYSPAPFSHSETAYFIKKD